MAFSWQQFILVAGAHFLALLSPGPDFFLIVRGALLHGWRKAAALCLGIATANGVFIVLAIGGFSALRPHSPLFYALQAGGCLYLAYLGGLLIRHARPAGTMLHTAGRPGAAAPPPWLRRFATGFASGILNPKNALFYASLFALLAGDHIHGGVQLAYGLWMFGAVLAWDLAVAASIGHPAIMACFARYNAAIERVTGAVLLLIAAGGLWLLANAVAPAWTASAAQ
ncbi:LysE family translocator [Bordetella sp. BOR01]|uniref:LysE family translocator n=1 Tax=Bordetella sp. BOR01 TaxID=2854779 RepID=UPI001C45E41A|nr:LysE family transporter [Bordetella sp. BOR01]MBV7486797.1 LysE family transporter [Bordetella sp. BOR01]